MGERAAKNALYDGFAEIAKAVANGRRAEIVDVLAQGERHVEELAAEIDQSIANTSFHLRALAEAGLVTTRRDGNRIYYRLASARVADLWTAVRDVAVTHLKNLESLTDAYLGDRTAVEEIDREELVRRLADGDVIVVDVRPVAEYAAGHIAGARSIPHDQLADRLAELPRGIEVVAYCRGPFCVYADDAVRLLRSRRRRARRLRDGYPEWRRADLPVSEEAAS
ncbi:MAG: ArsR/SmtB family transcription factor [Acidimicrobiia bacterium]